MLINNQEKNLFGNLLKNVVNDNEEEVRKNEKMKNSLLICMKNVLKNLDLNDVEESATKEGIDYIKDKYRELLSNEKNQNQQGDKLSKLNKVVGKEFFLFFLIF